MHTLLAMPLGAIRFKVFCPRTLQHADDCQKMGSGALGVVILFWSLPSTPSKGILPFCLGFLCFVLHGSHSLKDVWGIEPCVSDVDWGGGGIPCHTQASAACCVIRQIQYVRDRPAPPPLSSRTSSYGVSGLDTCWVHRALSVPRDLPMSLCISAGALGYVKHPHIWPRSSFLYAAALWENGYMCGFNLKMSVDGDAAAPALPARLCCTLSEAVCRRQHGCFQRSRPLSVWITAAYICIMPVIMG